MYLDILVFDVLFLLMFSCFGNEPVLILLV